MKIRIVELKTYEKLKKSLSNHIRVISELYNIANVRRSIVYAEAAYDVFVSHDLDIFSTHFNNSDLIHMDQMTRYFRRSKILYKQVNKSAVLKWLQTS